jgi:translation initiation factor 3 subunit H
MKHCKQNVPETVTGQLLGLAVNGKLEVTNCFASLDQEAIETPNEAISYQINMLKCLRQVNGDTNAVGWYQSELLGSGFSEAMIEAQYGYQVKIQNSVVLLYDPLQSLTLGTIVLKAFRLSEEFMKLFPTGFDSKRCVSGRGGVALTHVFLA